MEGKYGLHQNDEPLDKHVHVIFRFTDGSELRYRDVRKFGTMHLFKPGEELTELPLRQLGPEPFSEEFTAGYLRERLKKTNRSVKTALLDQRQWSGWAIFMSTRLYSEPVSIPRQQRTSSQKNRRFFFMKRSFKR
jgi:formamidopyrimidine-DNA glycosylase